MATARENILSVFGSRLGRGSEGLSNKTQYYAYKSFTGFVAGRDLRVEDYNESLMTEWVSWMFYEGLSKNTAATYLRLVYALAGNRKYQKDPRLKEAHVTVSRRLEALPDGIFRQNVGGRVIHRLQNLIAIGRTGAGDTRLGIDMLLFAVLCGGLSFRQLADWKKEDPLPDSALLQEIRQRYAEPRRKYLFPLDQSRLTPAQVDARIAALFKSALRLAGLAAAADPSATAADLWLTAIYETTGSIRRAVDISGISSATCPAFALMKPGNPVDEEERDRFFRHVRNIIVNDPVQWYAMRLRPGVTYYRMMQRVQAEDQTQRFADIYYPVVEIVRRAGRKIVFDDRPAVSGLVFFMSRASDVTPIFRVIGDLAWCYRLSRAPGAPYAVIPDEEIRTLQTAIGYIDPKADVVLEEEDITFEPGDRILIRSGELAGKYADITLVQKKNGRLLYRLTFPDGNGLAWTVAADTLRAEKILSGSDSWT